MPLRPDAEITMDNWVEMTKDVSMRYEIDSPNDVATLYFGRYENYALVLNRDNLEQVVTLVCRAITDLDLAERSGRAVAATAGGVDHQDVAGVDVDGVAAGHGGDGAVGALDSVGAKRTRFAAG